MAQHTAVVTDSASCLPADLASAWGVTVAPLQVVIGDEAADEGAPGLAERVVEALVAGVPVTTSQPSLGACIAALEEAGRQAESVVAVTLSSAISGTHSVMEAAAREVGVPVTVVDSRTVSLGHGFAALSAAAAARAGLPPQEVAREAADVSRSAMCLFTVETLEHLKRGGRVTPAVAALGTALRIRPVLGVIGGEVQAVDRVRTAAKARATMLERIASRAPAMRRPVVGLVTLPGDEAVAEAARQALGMRGAWPVMEAPLSAVLAVHAGPGALAAIVADVRPEIVEALSV